MNFVLLLRVATGGISDHLATGHSHGRHRRTDREADEQRLTSRPGALIWSFRKSRDRWKKKHQDLRATVKGFKNQVAAVTKSREQWRLKAERASKQVAELEAEVAGLPAQSRPGARKKKTRLAKVAEGTAAPTL